MLQFTFSSSLVSHYNVFPVTVWRPVPLIGSMTPFHVLLLAVLNVLLLAVITYFLNQHSNCFIFETSYTTNKICIKLFKRCETIRRWVLQHDQ